MLKELEATILARLRGTDRAPVQPMRVPAPTVVKEGEAPPKNPVWVPVSVTAMLPEDFSREPHTFTKVNVWRYMHEPDRARFRTGHHHTRVAPDGRSLGTKEHMLPYKTGYEITIRTRYQEQFKALVEEIEQRLPPIGYGSFLMVPFKDGDVLIPFASTRFTDRTDSNQSGERSFVGTFSYEFDTWADSGSWSQNRIVRRVDITADADVLAAAHRGTPYAHADATDAMHDDPTLRPTGPSAGADVVTVLPPNEG